MVRSLEGVLVCVAIAVVGCASPEEQPSPSPSNGAASGGSAAKPGGGLGNPTSGGPALDLGTQTQVPEDTEPDPTCQAKPVGILRDFQSGGDTMNCPVNLDFQNPVWGTQAMPFMPDIGLPDPGIVLPLLGNDKKPQFSGVAKTVHSADSFAMWYRDEPLCNKSLQYELPMQYDMAAGKLVFDSKAFFPLDSVAPPDSYGMSGLDDAQVMHDFHFTFELHMTFRYAGNETFDFKGDDDLWVFINKKLVIDLGGVHAPLAGSIGLPARAAELGLEIGQEYPIDFFQAERMTSQSNFHIETSLAFTNCKPIIVPK